MRTLRVRRSRRGWASLGLRIAAATVLAPGVGYFVGASYPGRSSILGRSSRGGAPPERCSGATACVEFLMQVAACIRDCAVRLFSGIPSYRFGRFILVNRPHHTTLAVSRRRHSWTPGSGSDPADRNRDTGGERVIRIVFGIRITPPLCGACSKLIFHIGVAWVMGPMPCGLGAWLRQRLPPGSRGGGLPEPSSRGPESPRGVSDFIQILFFPYVISPVAFCLFEIGARKLPEGCRILHSPECS